MRLLTGTVNIRKFGLIRLKRPSKFNRWNRLIKYFRGLSRKGYLERLLPKSRDCQMKSTQFWTKLTRLSPVPLELRSSRACTVLLFRQSLSLLLKSLHITQYKPRFIFSHHAVSQNFSLWTSATTTKLSTLKLVKRNQWQLTTQLFLENWEGLTQRIFMVTIKVTEVRNWVLIWTKNDFLRLKVSLPWWSEVRLMSRGYCLWRKIVIRSRIERSLCLY